MLEFFREGGFSMFIILALGLADLILAGSLAWRFGERKLGILRPVSLATVFATLLGMTSNIAAVMKNVAQNPEWAHSPDMHLITMVGIGESMAPAVMGFGILSATWLLVAVGLRRQD
jgi:hypothetical protein